MCHDSVKWPRYYEESSLEKMWCDSSDVGMRFANIFKQGDCSTGVALMSW